MIIEETFEIPFEVKSPVTISMLEKAIRQKGIDPVRYSLISVNNDKIKLSVAGVRKEIV